MCIKDAELILKCPKLLESFGPNVRNRKNKPVWVNSALSYMCYLRFKFVYFKLSLYFIGILIESLRFMRHSYRVVTELIYYVPAGPKFRYISIFKLYFLLSSVRCKYIKWNYSFMYWFAAWVGSSHCNKSNMFIKLFMRLELNSHFVSAT